MRDRAVQPRRSKPSSNTTLSRSCSPNRRKLGRGIARQGCICGRIGERETCRVVSSQKLSSTMGKILSWRETSVSWVTLVWGGNRCWKCEEINKVGSALFGDSWKIWRERKGFLRTFEFEELHGRFIKIRTNVFFWGIDWVNFYTILSSPSLQSLQLQL